jgi:hypothetical protein
VATAYGCRDKHWQSRGGWVLCVTLMIISCSPSSNSTRPAIMNPVDEKYDNLDDIILNTWDISVILACAGSRFRACLTHLQCKAEFADWPSERVTYIRTGLHWELAVCWHTANGTLSYQSVFRSAIHQLLWRDNLWYRRYLFVVTLKKLNNILNLYT